MGAFLSGCSLLRGNPEVHYKVTVEVNANGAVKTGSSVWSWRLSEPVLPLASAYEGKFRGEAVAVDLGNGRNLFAILVGADGDEGMAPMLPERFFGDIGRSARNESSRFHTDRIADLRNISSRTGETVTLDCSGEPGWCPMLVTFRNITDPKTLERVVAADLGVALGSGITLRGITAQITDEPVTTGIERKLGWLADVNQTLRGSGFHPDHIPVGDFKGLFSKGVL